MDLKGTVVCVYSALTEHSLVSVTVNIIRLLTSREIRKAKKCQVP